MSTVSSFEWTAITESAAAYPPGMIRAGVDRVELAEFRRTLRVAGPGFVQRIYTSAEIGFCHGRVERLATRFAAKEAVAKVLGTGIRGVGWHEIEIVTTAAGQPSISLHRRAAARAEQLGMSSLALSLSHTSTVAEAFAVALCTAPEISQPTQEGPHG